jgi:hypothetical protein
MTSSVIVWDIETAPDLRGFAGRERFGGKVQRRVARRDGGQVPKLIFHSIVRIGALVAQRQEEHWSISPVGAPHIGEQSEKESRGVGGGGLVTGPRLRQ